MNSIANNLKDWKWNLSFNVDQITTIIIKDSAGPKKKRSAIEVLGNKDSFINNLNPSNTGCSNPLKKTLLGPKRFCLNPKILRSNSVTKATPNIIRTTLTMRFNNQRIINKTKR